MPLAAGLRFGRFELLERLGAGGMGEVYRARDHGLDREVAVKFLAERFAESRDRLTRFALEARAASALSHPNIVTVHEVGELSGRPYLVLELVEGPTLRELVAGGRALPVRRTLEIATQLAEGLARAHAAGIVHRDLKPENVMVSRDGLVKILDFGLAKLREPANAEAMTLASTLDPGSGAAGPHTLAGTVLGTIGYMAPEQARGAAVDFRADQFAFGAILYELATGRRAFERASAVETLAAILDQEPEPLSTAAALFPAPARWAVERCLAKDPAGRYASTVDLAHELRAVRDHLTEVTSSSAPPAPAGRLRPAGRTARLTLGLGAAAVALLLPLAVPGVREGLARRVLGLSPLPAERRVAVLPLRVAADSEEDRFRADGLAEALTARLSHLDSARDAVSVVPASDVLMAGVSTAEAARRLFGATLVLTGSLERLGERWRLSAALVDAVGLNQLRALEPRDYRVDDPALADDFLAGAAQLLELELGAAEQGARASGVPAAGDVWALYLEARGRLQRFERRDELERAISLLQEAAARDPSYALAFAGLGEAYWRLYELTKHPELVELARQNCRRALALDDLQAPVYVTLGLISRGTGQTESALDSYARALDRDPRNADALRERGRALAGAGRIEEAESSFERALALRPSDWATYNYRGAMRVGENRLEDAARDFERVTLLAPDNPRGHTNLGVVSFKLGRLEEALTTLRRSVEIRPTAVALTNLGATLFYLERFAEAARVFGDAVALDEHNSTAWLNLGRARHHDAPGSAPARAALERAVELAEAERSVNPRDAAVLAALADANSMLGQGRRARDYAERALELAPGEPDVRALAGSVFEALGDRERALTELGAALAAGYPRWEIERDPDLAGLRADPRYTQLNPKA